MLGANDRLSALRPALRYLAHLSGTREKWKRMRRDPHDRDFHDFHASTEKLFPSSSFEEITVYWTPFCASEATHSTFFAAALLLLATCQRNSTMAECRCARRQHEQKEAG